MLPSGRVLCYPYAKFDEDGISYAKSAWKPAQDAKHWPRARLWKGLACENITQAIANDLLRYALRKAEDLDLNVVLHCHDELVVECDAHEAEHFKSKLKTIMCTPPVWCVNLPLAAEIKIMGRYGK
jgi:DNA polymerase